MTVVITRFPISVLQYFHGSVSIAIGSMSRFGGNHHVKHSTYSEKDFDIGFPNIQYFDKYSIDF